MINSTICIVVMLSSWETVHHPIRLLALLLALQTTWIVSINAFFHSNPNIHVHKPTFGHQRQRRPYRHHPRHPSESLVASTINNDSFFDMEELQQRIRAERQRLMLEPTILKGHSQRRSPTSISSKSQVPLDYVYIVSFPETTNKKNTASSLSSSSVLNSQNGGIHSIAYPSGKNVILAFTNQKSCDLFVQHLRRQQFFDPMTLKISVEALVEICLNVGVMMELIPDGVDILPPQQHVTQFGLQQDVSSIHEYRQIQKQQEKLNFAYYMLDETDDFSDEGVLLDYSYPSDDASADATTTLGVFD